MQGKAQKSTAQDECEDLWDQGNARFPLCDTIHKGYGSLQISKKNDTF